MEANYRKINRHKIIRRLEGIKRLAQSQGGPVCDQTVEWADEVLTLLEKEWQEESKPPPKLFRPIALYPITLNDFQQTEQALCISGEEIKPPAFSSEKTEPIDRPPTPSPCNSDCEEKRTSPEKNSPSSYE